MNTFRKYCDECGEMPAETALNQMWALEYYCGECADKINSGALRIETIGDRINKYWSTRMGKILCD